MPKLNRMTASIFLKMTALLVILWMLLELHPAEASPYFVLRFRCVKLRAPDRRLLSYSTKPDPCDQERLQRKPGPENPIRQVRAE